MHMVRYVFGVLGRRLFAIAKSYPIGDHPNHPPNTLVKVGYGGWVVVSMVLISCKQSAKRDDVAEREFLGILMY